jgi:outer membrane immunogenic protein
MKIRRSLCGSLLLAGACMSAPAAGFAQSAPGSEAMPKIVGDLALTYNTERGELAPGDCGCFWLQGIGLDAALSLRNSIGIAAGFNTGRAPNVTSGINVEKVQYLAGPRYTFTAHGKSAEPRTRLQLFGQALFGGVHAYNGAYPSPTGLNKTASSYAIEVGGGVNLLFAHGFGLRLVEADYVRNALPNNFSNTQNDTRIAVGVSWRFRGH